ncbi:MAG: transglutaminase domain-containing protein [Flavipsychrobacter sp.]
MYKHLLILCIGIVFSFQLKAQIDTTNGFTAPNSVSKDHVKLTKYLCEGIVDDQLKANLIYNWITHNLSFNLKDAQKPEKQNPSIKEVLHNTNTVGNGYANLFISMCREANLNAVPIHGYHKKFYHNLGGEFHIAKTAMCAVLINGTWQFIDPVSGSGIISHEPKWLRKQLNRISKNDVLYVKEGVFVSKYQPEYFMIAPQKVRKDFLAADPIWQLLSPPMSLNIFSGNDSINEAFNKGAQRINNTPQLTKIGHFNEEEQVTDRVNRTHQFNPNYWLDLARAEQIESYKYLKDYINAPIDGDYKKAILKAIELRKNADGYIDSQKKKFPAYYSGLKKKNTARHIAINGRIREVKKNIKTETSALNREITKSDNNRKELANTKSENLQQQKGIDEEKIKKIKTAKEQKDVKSTTLVAKVVNINAKSKEIQEQNNLINEELKTLEKHFAQVDPNYELYSSKSALVDSLLQLEIYSMVGLSLDDENQYQEYINKSKAAWTDITIHREALLTAYDSTLASFKRIDKAIVKQHKLYGDILKDMEDYKALNDKWMELEQVYAETVNNYQTSINSRNQNINLILELHNFLIENFQRINKNREDSEETIALMQKIEDQRKDITETLIIEDKDYDENILKHMAKVNDESIKELKKILTK